MHRASRLAAAFLIASPLLLADVAGAATPARLQSAEKACKPGSDPQDPGNDSHPGGFMQRQGKTPSSLPGAVTVSPREAKCLMDKLGAHLVVIQAMGPDERELPGARAMPGAGTPASDPEVQKVIAENLRRLTEGDKERPLLIYCHHASCHLSYNLSIRAAQAGYRKVFWMRQGQDGWIKAGYPLKSQVLDANGLPGNYPDQLQACNEEVREFGVQDFVRLATDNASDSKLDAELQSRMKRSQEVRAGCLQGLATKLASNAAAKADLAARLSRNAGEVGEYYKAIRALVEKDPAQYFKPALDEYDVAALRRTLAKARNTKSVAERCGTLDTNHLPSNNEEIAAMNRRLAEFRACLKSDDLKLEDLPQALADRSEQNFLDAVREMQGIARYTCSRWKGTNCVPDAAWRRVADVASPANGEIVEKVEREVFQRLAEEREAEEQANAWVERVNANSRRLEEEARREQEESNSRRTYYAPSYPPPPPAPTYRRQPHNIILPGVK